MKRAFEIFVPLVAAASLTSGCADTYQVDLTEPSRVIDLEFTPEHEESRTGDCLWRDKGVCYWYDEYDVTIPNEWSMTVEQCDSGPVRTQEEELCDNTTVSITAEDFSLISLFDYIIVRDGQVDRISR